jgi:hypothetical protein
MPVKASAAAAKAVAANPAASDRAIAERIGVGKDTVRRAREVAQNAPPEKRIGRDGKSYRHRRFIPLKMRTTRKA